LEIPKLVLILHYLACFQKGLFGGNFEQKYPWSFRDKNMPKIPFTRFTIYTF
jgi:hypothetical protein